MDPRSRSSLAFMLPLLLFAPAGFDYADALAKSTIYLEGQRSGKLPPGNRMTRGRLRDDFHRGVDLVGGYYDAGARQRQVRPAPMAWTSPPPCWRRGAWPTSAASWARWASPTRTTAAGSGPRTWTPFSFSCWDGKRAGAKVLLARGFLDPASSRRPRALQGALQQLHLHAVRDHGHVPAAWGTPTPPSTSAQAAAAGTWRRWSSWRSPSAAPGGLRPGEEPRGHVVHGRVRCTVPAPPALPRRAHPARPGCDQRFRYLHSGEDDPNVLVGAVVSECERDTYCM
ncbi:hypothetical protein U9M48_041196 [Paspalum notatum var. saurae]|uniref:cellulase n=1 Tax=Paspalum notatum var. saurae TaxID=547442 RepID=A0AAQ3UN91_PASNO